MRLFNDIGLVPFFEPGAFAWDGILAFWLVASTYLLWIFVMCVLLHNSIKVAMREDAAHAQGKTPPCGSATPAFRHSRSGERRLVAQVGTAPPLGTA